jgi:dipeptidyl aminopeptidase/acylaminoacyl peptidase
MIFKLFSARILILFALAALPLAAAAVTLEDLMRHAEFEELSISPKGDYLAATAPQDGQTGVVILDISDLDNPEISGAFRLSRNENATNLLWATNERLVFTSTLQAGILAQPFFSGNFYAINADGSRMRQIFGRTDMSTFRIANIIHRLPDDENHVLISKRLADDPRPSAFLMNINNNFRTGLQRQARRLPLRLVTRSPLDSGALAADQDGQVRFAFGTNDDGEQQFAWREDADGEWTTFNNPLGADISFWGFDHDGQTVFVASRDQDSLGVHRVHLASGQTEALLVDDTFEAIRPIFNEEGTTLIGAVFATPRPEARFFTTDNLAARIWRGLAASLPNHFVSLSNFTEDQRLAVVQARSDREPGVFLMLNTETMQAGELLARKSWVDHTRLAHKQPIEFTARDGLELHGYLTVPPDSDGRNLPLVVEVHGGPHGPRDDWFYEPWVQAMALRGLAVLQINFRGSGGRGQQFERDAYGQWGAEMQDDITDGTRWAIEQGIADPGRICLSGASYGGYSTLVGLVREPELYRCGFAFVGVYDLALAKEEGNIPSTEAGRRYLDRALGTDEQVLAERSPINSVEKIRVPLFVAHGAEDQQAHVGQYHALIKRLEDARVPHQALLVNREGHGFYDVDNRVSLYGQVLDFFDSHIGRQGQ